MCREKFSVSGFLRVAAASAVVFVLHVAPANAFSFADEEAKTKAEAETKRSSRGPSLSDACRERLKKERAVVLVAERGNQGVNADQGRYGAHFQIIDQRLRKLGLRTFSQEEIRKQVAQAEIDAHFRNDPDAALAASKRLGASMTLRGLILSRRSINPMLNINEVSVNMQFELIGADGRSLGQTSASADTYSGSDTLGMALTLVQEQAGSVVSKLMNGYCGTKSAVEE